MQIFNHLQEGNYALSKNILNFRFTIKTFLKEFNNIFIIIQDYVAVKIINFLNFKFEIYITVLIKKTYNKKKFLNLNLLLKNLKEKKLHMTRKTLLGNI